jgi:hypothetical protein
MLIAILFGVLSFTAVNTTQAVSATEAALRQRAERYHSYFSRGRYNLMWEMSSKALRERNNNDKGEYVRQLRKYGFGKMKAEIGEIQIQGNQAKVRMKISVWSQPDKKWLNDVEEETWVFERGRWAFEDHRVAESATGGEGR